MALPEVHLFISHSLRCTYFKLADHHLGSYMHFRFHLTVSLVASLEWVSFKLRVSVELVSLPCIAVEILLKSFHPILQQQRTRIAGLVGHHHVVSCQDCNPQQLRVVRLCIKARSLKSTLRNCVFERHCVACLGVNVPSRLRYKSSSPWLVQIFRLERHYKHQKR